MTAERPDRVTAHSAIACKPITIEKGGRVKIPRQTDMNIDWSYLRRG